MYVVLFVGNSHNEVIFVVYYFRISVKTYQFNWLKHRFFFEYFSYIYSKSGDIGDNIHYKIWIGFYYSIVPDLQLLLVTNGTKVDGHWCTHL
jgi:hypothetical protein